MNMAYRVWWVRAGLAQNRLLGEGG